jgi:hypothetical protein
VGEQVDPGKVEGIMSEEGPVKVGTMGAGKISGIYLQNAAVCNDIENVAGLPRTILGLRCLRNVEI